MIASLVDEDEDGSRKRIITKLLANNDAQAIKALTKIAGFSSHADLDAVSQDHACSLVGVKMRRTTSDPNDSSATGTREGVHAREEGSGDSTTNSTNSGPLAEAFGRLAVLPK